MRYLVLLVLGLGFFAGCSSSEKLVRSHPVEEGTLRYEFVVEQDYQVVYRKLLKQGQACVSPGLTAQMIVEGELFDDIKAADITVVLYGIFSQHPHLKVAIKSTEQDKTKVTVTNTLPRWDSYARAIKTWVVDGSTNCSIPD
jgi:hypothetical protein